MFLLLLGASIKMQNIDMIQENAGNGLNNQLELPPPREDMFVVPDDRGIAMVRNIFDFNILLTFIFEIYLRVQKTKKFKTIS